VTRPPLHDAARLAVGTLTALRVPAPRVVDQRVGAWAMTLAPLVGALLAVLAGGFLWLLGWGPPGNEPPLVAVLGDRAHALVVDPLLASVVVIGLLAVITRGIHLDGLADTADGLGSGRPADQALEVMRRGDVGPFGVVTLVLVLLTQVVALAELTAAGLGPAALFVALVVSRLALAVVCSRGIPAARSEGLGHGVAGTVGRGQLALSVVIAAVLLAGLALVSPGLPALNTSVALRVVVVVLLALLVAGLVVRRAVRRLGGVTGDVLGAAVEVTFTTVLVLLTLLT